MSSRQWELTFAQHLLRTRDFHTYLMNSNHSTTRIITHFYGQRAEVSEGLYCLAKAKLLLYVLCPTEPTTTGTALTLPSSTSSALLPHHTHPTQTHPPPCPFSSLS